MVVVMHGLVTIEPLIAQGCRALSEESVWLVQGCSGNIISAVSSPHEWHWLSLALAGPHTQGPHLAGAGVLRQHSMCGEQPTREALAHHNSWKGCMLRDSTWLGQGPSCDPTSL